MDGDRRYAKHGRPPSIKAHGQDKQVIMTVADDRPRQVELMRLIGRGIDRVDVNAPDGASLVQIAFPGHTRGEQSSRASRHAGSKQSMTKTSVKKK
jgi:hypothetical protein